MIVEDGDLDILWIFSDTIRRMAEGELLQLERSFDPTVTEAHYYAVIERKSAALLSAACEAGAILGGVTRAERRRLAEFGREFGLAFQLRDDALDYEAREAELGKRPYADLREGKVTLPLLLALKRCTRRRARGGRALLKTAGRRAPRCGRARSPTRDLDIAPVSTSCGATAASRTPTAAPRSTRARAHAIAPFPDGGPSATLLEAAEFAVAARSLAAGRPLSPRGPGRELPCSPIVSLAWAACALARVSLASSRRSPRARRRGAHGRREREHGHRRGARGCPASARARAGA